jgi:hypothetical protein
MVYAILFLLKKKDIKDAPYLGKDARSESRKARGLGFVQRPVHMVSHIVHICLWLKGVVRMADPMV